MNALCLPLLFFLHAFHPHPKLMVLPVLAGVLDDLFGPPSYDHWLMKLIDEYNPPNRRILVIGEYDQVERSVLVTYWQPEVWESVPYPDRLRNSFGLVIEEAGAPLTNYQIEYRFNLLVRGGTFLVVKGRKVIMAIIKNGHEVFSPHFKILPLNDHDMTVLRSLMETVKSNTNRILLVGSATHWIDRLRREGWVAYGIDINMANLSLRDIYYSSTPTYDFMPFHTEFFKLICLFVQAETATILEADRTLMAGGLMGFIPQIGNYYEDVMQFLNYRRTGIVFHGMPIWQKPIDEAA